MANDLLSPSFSDQSSASSRSGRSDIYPTAGLQSYGTITFRRNRSNRTHFIRISPDVPPNQVKDLFFRQHQHKRASLIISITGSARDFSMKSKIFRIFRQGLLKIAKTTDISILTCGVNTSVTKLIGEIVRTNPDPSRPIHLIGLAQWGCISGVEQLDVRGTNVNYEKPKIEEKDETALEPNHKYFIFIDDGTKHQYEAETQYRSKFERAISGETVSLKVDDRSKSPHIPVVLVVIEGGLDTIKKVHETVTKNNIPVVLMQGTGGCCDLFAKCYRLYHEYYERNSTLQTTENEDLSSLNEKKEQIKSKLREKLQIVDNKICLNTDITLENLENDVDYFELIYECIDQRDLFLNFIDFQVHSHIEPDVDLAILEALLNVTTGDEPSKINLEQKREQLNLAFEWKRIDIVKNYIMKNDQDWKKIELNDLFLRALRENQTAFIQLFLDHDFSLNDLFEQPEQLLTLYDDENFTQKHEYRHPLEAVYTELLRPFIGDFFQVEAIFHSDFDSEEIDVEKELFLWSILTRKQELALLFWARARNKVCAALIAMLLYKSKARKEKDDSYLEHADDFEKLAVQILEKFYQTNPFECTQAIIRAIPQFGNVTWLHLAVMAEAKLFIAQKAVQDVLSDIWYGYIDHRVGNRIIIFTSFFIGYSGFLPYHQELVEGHEMSGDFLESNENFFKPFSTRPKHRRDEVRDSATSKLMDEIINEEENCVVVVDTNPWQKIKSGVRQYFENVSKFLHAPCVNYIYNLYSHMIFLLLFSYVVLCDFFPLYEFVCIPGSGGPTESNAPLRYMAERATAHTNETKDDAVKRYGLQRHNQPATSEIILDVWILTLICEEIRQIITMEVAHVFGKLVAYFQIFWNRLDALALLLFILSFILRWLPYSYCFCIARIFLAIDLSLWYIRTLDIFSAIKRLGPKLVMIGEMVSDMKFYMLMLTVFILAYGVPAYSLLYGVQEFSWHIPRTILNLAYWQMFGELEVLGDIEKNYEITGYVVFFLLIAYMTVASVLLINLLIAMFSNTFDRLQSDTDCIWKFQHYSLVCYHLTRPVLPPPLVIFSHIYRATVYICLCMFKSRPFYENYIRHKNQSKFKIVADEMLTKKIEAIEDALGNDVHFYSLKTDRKQSDRQNDLNEERGHSPQEIVLNKIKILETQIQTIQTQQGNMFECMEYLMNGIKKIGGNDIEMPVRLRQELETN